MKWWRGKKSAVDVILKGHTYTHKKMIIMIIIIMMIIMIMIMITAGEMKNV